ncbi:MAG: CheY-like chemotaxis protein [Gammaproteobacteria bacterium]|jgi:CheY-like chemotaxis protein
MDHKIMSESAQTIGIKLALISATLIIAILSVGMVGINALDTLKKNLNTIVDISANKVQLGDKIQQDLLKITRAEQNIIAAPTQIEMDGYAAFIEQTYRNLIQRLDLFQALVGQENRVTIDEFRQKLTEYMAVNNKVREYARLNSNAQARNLSATSARKAFDKAEVALGNIVLVNDRIAESHKKQAAEAQLKALYGTQIQNGMLSILRAERNIILSTSVEGMRKYANKIEALQSDLFTKRTSLRELTGETGTFNLDKFSRKWERWTDVYNRVLELTLLNSNVRALNLSNGEAQQSFVILEESLIKIGAFHEDRFQEATITNDPVKLARFGLIIKSSAQLLRNVVEYQRAEKNLILAPTQAAMDIYMQVMSDLDSEIDRRFVQLQMALETVNENIDALQKSRLAYKIYRAHNSQVRKLSRENGNRRAFDLATGEGRQLADDAELQLDIIVKENILLNTKNAKLLALAHDHRLLTSRMIQIMLAIHRAEKSLILEKTQVGMDGFADTIEIFKIDLQAKLSRFKTMANDEELDGLIFFEQFWLKYLVLNEQVRVLSRQNGNQFAYDLASSQGRKLSDQAEVLISDLVTKNELSSALDRDLSNRLYNKNFFMILIVLALSTFFGAIFSFFMIRNVLNVIMSSAKLNERSQWTKNGQAEMAGVMGAGRALDELSNSIIIGLAKYVGASVGVIYLANDNDAYTRTGSYAYSHHKQALRTIKAGEGSVGQAIQDANTIMVSELPDDYIEINSGLGGAVPRHLMIVPLKLEDRVIGAIEIGSFEPFTDLQIEFVELVSGAIAIAVRAGQNQERVSNLLEESQTQSEELQAQQEELRIFNEELEEKTDSLQKQKKEIEASNMSFKQAQVELEEQAHELKVINTYKSQFLANMSHELRTPLNSMLLLSKSLMSDRLGNLQDEQIEDAKIIYEGGQDLLNLINDIMDLSKVEAGMMTVNYELVELESIKAGLQRLFDPVATSENLKFKVDITDTAPKSIKTDGQRLEQVLNNLLSNAFKFTETGEVILRISPHSPSTDSGINKLKNKNLLVFSVIDTGKGIPTDKQQVVFEAFQQVDGTTSRNHGGTGLGLAISRELTHLLGGEILIESKEGEGSCFSLYLPLNETDRIEPKQIEPEEQQLAPLLKAGLAAPAIELQPTQYISDDRNQIDDGDQNILIIEDDRDFAKALMKTVRSSGYKCLAAADGRSGLYLATEFQLCGILLDMGLPDIDGLQVIKQLKYQARTASVPIHVISGHDRQGEVIASGVTGYLQKPATREDIESALSNIGQLSVKNMRHILVVEDDHDNQRAIASLFRGSTIEFAFAANGNDACRHIKSTQFDCVILDLNLPDMSGFDVLKKVTSNSRKALPPIIIYTGRELTDAENVHLAEFTSSIIVKDAESPERLIDEVAMFLHSDAVKGQSETKQAVRMLHNDDILFRDRTILLVDDDMRNVYVLSRELQYLGLNVLMAENGQVALNKLKESPAIELVLMDIMMPVMDGYEAMRKIRGIRKFAKLPVIALTAKAMPEDRALCIEAGASEYLTKPINVDKLKAMLRVWLFERTESNA